MASAKDKTTTTVIDLIKNTFYIEKTSQQQTDQTAGIFKHPFNSRILLNTSVDTSYEELIDRVLEIGRPEREPESILDSLTIDDEVATYLALPSQVKQQLKDMFVKARRRIESKPRGSIDRKLSHASISSQKYAAIINRRKKSRKLSNVSRFSQVSNSDSGGRCKSSLTADLFKERRKDSREKYVGSTDGSSLIDLLSKMVLVKNLKSDISSTKNDPEADFFVSPFYYNSLKEEEDRIETRENERAETNDCSWSKRENSRRKVNRWLRTSN